MMNLYFKSLVLLLISASLGYYGHFNLDGKLSSICIYFAGIVLGIFLMNLKLNSKNNKLSSYKRELEKESVTSDKAEAKVKVLESKIKVLEKALDNALNK